MTVSNLNNNIFDVNSNKKEFTSNNINKSNYTFGSKIPQTKDVFVKKISPDSDNKFSFLEFSKNIAKGAGQFFVDIAKNIVENPLISIPILILGAAAASTPLGLMILSGAGLWAGIFGLGFLGVKSANLITDKKWDELEEKGKDLGKLIPATVISALGALRGAKILEKASKAQNTSLSLSASAKKSLKINADLSWIAIKNIVKIPYKVFKSKSLKPSEIFFEPLKKDYHTAISKLKPSSFTQGEKIYLHKQDGLNKLFDWKFSDLKGSILTVLKQIAGD